MQTESVCTLRSVVLFAGFSMWLKHYCLPKKSTSTEKGKEKKTGWKSTCLEAGLSNGSCVTPSLTGDSVKCQPTQLCIYDQLKVMIGSALHQLGVCVHVCVLLGFSFEVQLKHIIITQLQLENDSLRFSLDRKKHIPRFFFESSPPTLVKFSVDSES